MNRQIIAFVFLLLLFFVPMAFRGNIAFAQDPKTLELCKYSGDSSECTDCMSQEDHIWTAIGCIPTNTSEIFKALFSFGIGIAGGIAFLLILIGGLQILTSSGNPEQLTAGKELVSAAITGLILIVFSVFLLKIIGVDILDLPGFS